MFIQNLPECFLPADTFINNHNNNNQQNVALTNKKQKQQNKCKYNKNVYNLKQRVTTR